MSDIVDRINQVHREVGSRPAPGGEAHTVLLRRTYDAGAEDVWDACTDPERMRRWFLPVTGDLRLGGTYQLEGNAGGEILRCEPPKLLRVSWLYGPDPGFSEVEVRLTPEGPDRTVFELEHVAVVPEEFWGKFGPGATGVGWDLMLLGLGMHLHAPDEMPDPAEWERTEEARAYTTRSSEEWGRAYTASGAPDEVVASAVRQTTAFYVPPLDGPDAPGS